MVEVLENYRSFFFIRQESKREMFYVFHMVTAGINTLDFMNVILSYNKVFQSMYITFSLQITFEMCEKKKTCFYCS